MSHSRLSPSGSSRVIACAASPNREAPFPDEGGPDAKAGTNYHWLAEQAFLENSWPPNVLKQGLAMAQAAAPEPEVDMTQDGIDMTKRYYDYVIRRTSELKPAVMRPEVKVVPQLYTNRIDDSGTADVLIVSDPLLEVIDFKTGGFQQEPDGSQLKLYALGAMAEYADPISGLPPFPKVRLTIFQPKRPGMDSIERSLDFTPQELIEWAMTVWTPAANASDDPNAKATPSDEACKYCKAQKNGKCPEYTAFVDQAASQLFQPVEGQAVEVVDPFQTQFRADGLTNEQMSQFLEAWPLMKARAKDIEAVAMERMKQRQMIPGFKLVAGRGSREWAHGEEEQVKKFRNMKLKLDDIYEKKLRSPNKLLGLEIPTKTKELIKKHVVHKSGALQIAPVTDKRKDAVPAVEFQPVETAPAAEPAADLSFLNL